jgi:hypothetical protein
MPLIDEYQLDYYNIDGIGHDVNFYYRPYIDLTLLVIPSIPDIPTAGLNVASDTPETIEPSIEIPSIPSISVGTAIT